MPILIPWYAWVIIGGGASAAAYKGVDNVTGKPFEIVKENAIPLALLGAGTFLALRAMQKRGMA